MGPVVGAPTAGDGPLSAGTQHQAVQAQTGAWTGKYVDPRPFTTVGEEAWSNEVRAASVLAGTPTNDFDGQIGDTHYQQDNASETPGDDTEEYTIRVGMVEVPIGEAITKTIEFVVDKTIAGITSLVDTFNEYILGLPAPGEPTDVSTWMTAGGPWPAVYGVYGIMSALAIALLTPSFMVATDTANPRKQRERLIELGKAAFFILLGIPVTAFCLHLGNELTMALAPSGLELLTTAEGIGSLGIGLIFGFMIIFTKSLFSVIGIIATMLIYIMTYLTVAFWPLFWACRVQPQSTLKGFGHMGIAVFPLIILLKFIQSGILRFIHNLPLDSLGGLLFKEIATISGIAIALIGVPYIFMTKLLPGSAMLIGRRTSETTQKRGQTTAGETPGGQYTSQQSGRQPAGAQGGYYVGPRSQGPATTRRPVDNGASRSNVGPTAKRPDSARTRNEPPSDDSNRDGSEPERSRSTVGPQSKGPNG